jgi:hypothetical protein
MKPKIACYNSIQTLLDELDEVFSVTNFYADGTEVYREIDNMDAAYLVYKEDGLLTVVMLDNVGMGGRVMEYRA